ncbi:MAG: GNAT family N-acetyltransferase [Luminiphilus sp.]|nr:GNAT family N-acetyltransferase [Luminiphilus sp.]
MSAEAGSSAVDRSVFGLPLQTEHFSLEPLTADDFDALYAVASDPLLWEQHPEADRWKRSKFHHFFQGGLANDLGCFVIREKRNGKPAGSSRFYGYEETHACIRIGYTFIAREFWGTSANREIKEVMLSRSFQFVEQVYFDIGPQNFRSTAAVKKLGAVFSHDESDNKAVYVLSKHQWFNTSSNC